jgi:NAD(P)-dependent dehydrogenase (short-subunit alcohol dehydrogenase family)
MENLERLEGKVAVVTGAGSGIGRGSAIVLARAGARIVVNDIDADSGAETVNLIREAGREATFIHADVGRSDAVRLLVAQTEEAYGRLDIMFANAGISNYVDLEDMTEADFERMLDTNLKGFLLCAKHAIPAMKRAGGGSIVFCSSVLNTIGFPQCVVYSATKAGMIGASRSLAVEVGKYNIRVNVVSPGTMNTPMLARDIADMNVNEAENYLQKVRNANALGRLGEPEDIGNAVVWLSSEEASYVTGVNIFVDGAFTAVKSI